MQGKLRVGGKINTDLLRDSRIADIIKQMDGLNQSPSPASLDRLVEYIVKLEAENESNRQT
jgi:hypothetical protein